MTTSRAALIACLAFGLVSWAAPAQAQIDTASIVGTVRDASGAILPGVTVTATQEATNVTATTVTNTSGQFVFPNLKVGRYVVSAELEGFKRAVNRDVVLRVQDRAEVDFQLELGNLSETVQVKGFSEILQTQSADIGNVIDERQVRDLPLLGRRYSELAFLTPGVVVAPAGITSRGEDTFFNANGAYATWNNYTLDGADNNSFSTNLQERSPQVVQPPVDALQEFKVQTRTYSAEFGKAAGAIINASIKQGSNQVRGSAYGFFRDEAWNANTWENNRAGRPVGQFNQFIGGFTLGGPLVKNRTFFFGDYQDTRHGTRAVAVVHGAHRADAHGRPERADRDDDRQQPVRARGVCGRGEPSASTRPASIRWRRNSSSSTPCRTCPAAGFFNNNFISNGVLNYDINQFDVRVDHTFGANDTCSAATASSRPTGVEPPVLEDPVASGDFASNIFIRGQNFVTGWSRSSAPGLQRVPRRLQPGAVRRRAPGVRHRCERQYGIKGVPQDPRFYGGLPHMPIGRFTRLGGPFFRPQFQTSQVFQFSDNLTWTKGRTR